MSWMATTAVGARQTNNQAVLAWAEPVYDAFLAGAWFVYWTEKTLYWVAKPTLHCEPLEPQPNRTGRRLHCDNHAAVESDVENIYYSHGVMVPAFVVVKPEWITLQHIESETNAEVRRVMIERFGKDRYLKESGATKLHSDDFGTLWRKEIQGDEPLVMVEVVNSTPEPDGSFKNYWLRVPPTMQRAREAVAWTFGLREDAYAPEMQT